ncbi:MAG TPA: TonB-dependent receptor [Luteibaculaceae bacterium]|nr:TonB-dependent receptor [Luteibaculaceae bacterium]
MKCALSAVFCVVWMGVQAQTSVVGWVRSAGNPVADARVQCVGEAIGALTNEKGYFRFECPCKDSVVLEISALGYQRQRLTKACNDLENVSIELQADERTMGEVVISGNLREMSRMKSVVPVEVYQRSFLRKNPSVNLYDAMQNINGLRPQLNCQVCNTGDIHINGMEGPYTMILVDGMPLVSSLSTVYGLMGIPSSLIERVEVVKGPSSSLYGSEAMGGVINVITKSQAESKIELDVMSNHWGETSADLAWMERLGSRFSVLTGLHHFRFQERIDKNNDLFTDVALQNRTSIFQKWQMDRPKSRQFSMAGRYLNEDRWGGDLRWNESFKGGDSIYGEHIDTRRWEWFGVYELPFREKFLLQGSFNQHIQDSYYGTTHYAALQRVSFAQLLWYKTLGSHQMVAGASWRHTYFDDNTPATATASSEQINGLGKNTALPGVFVQDEWEFSALGTLMAGYRLDFHPVHGMIHTPRLGVKWKSGPYASWRLNAGTGYRVVQLFTEDHAALTGARKVLVEQTLLPERSVNINANFLLRKPLGVDKWIALDVSLFYTHFNNRITADYLSDPNAIIYNNLSGFASCRGFSASVEWEGLKNLKTHMGITFADNSITEDGVTTRQVLTERFSATYAISYVIPRWSITFDYTGNLYSPMILPTLGPLDPRKSESPWWNRQNIQVRKKWSRVEWYGGVKNILNWTPNRGNPFIIARSHDPFDKQVVFDAQGAAVATPENPYALTFDPSYVYAPNQGRLFYMGCRWEISTRRRFNRP